MSKLKIVHIEDFFHPDAGYQLNILPKYMKLAGHDVTIVTSELDKMPSYLTDFFQNENIKAKDEYFTKEYGIEVVRKPIFTYYSGRSIYKPGIFKYIDQLKPDVLFIHGEDTYFGIRAIIRLKKFRYAIIFDDHMTDIASKNKFACFFRFFYRVFITPRIAKYKLIVIRTMDDNFIFQRYNIPKEQGPLVEFGSDLLKFHPDNNIKIEIRAELGFTMDDLVFLYAGKLDESKGGQFLADAIKNRVKARRTINFLVIGNFSGAYGQKVKETLEASMNRVVMLPTQPYSRLDRYLKCADIAVFPKQCSLTFYDAQACGLPVILEDNSINKKRLEYNNGLLFKSGDKEDFIRKIEILANMDEDALQHMKFASEHYIASHYNYKDVADNYIRIIQNVYDEYKAGETLW